MVHSTRPTMGRAAASREPGRCMPLRDASLVAGRGDERPTLLPLLGIRRDALRVAVGGAGE